MIAAGIDVYLWRTVASCATSSPENDMTRHHSLHLRAMLSRALTPSLRYRGMLVLVIWQVPVQPVIGPDGSIGFMLGGGSDEHAELSCEGNLIDSERVDYRTAAAEVDYSLNPIVRVEATGGFMSSESNSHNGGFGTALLRADWKWIGLGAGLAMTPAFEQFASRTDVWPSVYVRAGSAQGFHLRGDLFPPTAFAAQHIARLGLGFNAVLRDQGSGFIGLVGAGSDEGATGVVAELTLPVSSRFALNVEAHYASGHVHPVAGLAAGGRFLLGSSQSMNASLRDEPGPEH
jgi:hypothetical protein